ncbi:MAG TPA: UvrD-helicase domain-containing protein [Syntrophales bacterium]|nr:UvrD-helicase domain-containing protein [Syntrophales bacterium]HOX95118.1 UvrD-helicase domain-containing protein [Syntrophales bacterium]HPI57856.1 UvrD-helicase domain-containing protein [Syntrophales bacterium]HQM28820.1 UvrD-helicase domain-containing protein [Syntrophales bacterium]
MRPELPDARQRQAALDTTRSHHVEAPAGSGKTLLLTLRFLKLLGEVRHPGEIIALTFTDKAAGEMRDRIIRYLKMARDSATPSGEFEAGILALAAGALKKQERFLPILTSSNGLNVMTFHSFCYYLVKRAPLEAGISPDCEVLGEQDLPVFLEEVVQRVMKNLIEGPNNRPERKALEGRLLAHNNTWVGLKEELKAVISSRDRFGDLIREIKEPSASTVRDTLQRRMRATVEALLENLSRGFHSSTLGRNWTPLIDHLKSRSAKACYRLPPSPPGTGWEALPAWRDLAETLLTKAGRPRKSLGPAGGFYGGFGKSPWGEMIANLDEDLCRALHEVRFLPGGNEEPTDVEALKDFILLSIHCIVAYDQACAQRHVMDFIGLEDAALRILREDEPTDLHLHLDCRVRHLLVDEFQDTSRNQWNLLQRLCSGWEPGDGRTLFIVGDPKQSIYAFRKAEVRLFMEAREGLRLPGRGHLPLQSLLLKTNFRSRRRLIEWCNDLFGNTVMVRPDADADEVPFSTSVPAPGAAKEATISLNLFTGDTETAKAKEATWLAREARKLIAETDGRKSVAILLFTRNRLHRYLQAFKAESIPLQVKEGLLLAERPEVLHLMQIARLIARPHDDVAWASLIRSPWNWFGRDLLYRVSLEDPVGWRDKILAAAEREPQMNALRRAIEHALQRGGRDPLGQVVRDFWEMLDGPRVTAALYGMAGIANCRQLFQVLETVEQGVPQETLTRLETLLKSLYEPVDPVTARSPVTMMTVHGAKGLEFDIVFIPFLDWRPLSSGGQVPPAYLLERMPGASGRHLVAMGTDRRTGEPTPLFRMLKKFQQDRRMGEAKRLFYVAATRAREALFLSGIAGLKDRGLRAAGGSLLEWVMDHEKITGTELANIQSQAAKAADIAVDPDSKGDFPPARKTAFVPPEPLPLHAEKIPYVIETPSTVHGDKTKLTGEGIGRSRESPSLAARGIVTHRILNRVIGGGSRPSRVSVEKALAREGVAGESVTRLAKEILEEVSAVLQDPIVSRLLKREMPVLRSEWAVEDSAADRRIRSGILDLVAYDGAFWWIIDFKTSKPPDGNIEDFVNGQTTLYRPQIEAYRVMLQKVEGVRAENIRAGIYLTALKQWIEMKF